MAINLFSGGNYVNSLTAAGKNKIINGDFGVWQRGTSFASAADSTYFADRFITNWSAGGATNTFSRQTFTPGTAPVSGYEGTYFARCAATGATGTTQIGLGQRIEDVRTFAGQTGTFSFWAKGDSARTLSYYIQQNFGSGGSATVNASGTIGSITTSWARYSVTVTLGAMTGKTIGTSSYLQWDIYAASQTGAPNIDIWGVQLELGNTATTFTTATGTIQGELAACQRYFISYGGQINYEQICVGSSQNTTTHYMWLALPVEMRTRPTIGYSSLSHWEVGLVGTGGQVYTALSEYYSGLKVACWSASTAALTNSGGNKAVNTNALNTTSARLTFSAEL